MFTIDPEHPDVLILRKHARIEKYKKGEIILRPYDEANHIYIILSGLVKVYVITSSGEQYIHIIYGKDEIFPLSWIINRVRYDVYYEAIADCEIVLIPKKILMEVIKTSHDVANALLMKAIEQFSLYGARVDNLEYKYAKERVAYRLLTLGSRFGERTKEGIKVPPMSQQDVASTINLTRESVSRELAYFERKGLIKVQDGYLIILNVEGLRKVVGEDAHIMLIENIL